MEKSEDSIDWREKLYGSMTSVHTHPVHAREKLLETINDSDVDEKATHLFFLVDSIETCKKEAIKNKNIYLKKHHRVIDGDTVINAWNWCIDYLEEKLKTYKIQHRKYTDLKTLKLRNDAVKLFLEGNYDRDEDFNTLRTLLDIYKVETKTTPRNNFLKDFGEFFASDRK